jgi:hypothetical protein
MLDSDLGQVDSGPEQVDASLRAAQFDWDDPLDQQIASVGQEVVRVQQDWSQADGAFGPLYWGLEEMAEELDQSPL